MREVQKYCVQWHCIKKSEFSPLKKAQNGLKITWSQMLTFPWNRGVLPKANVTFGCQQQWRDKPEYYKAVNPTSCWEILQLISKRAGANRSICFVEPTWMFERPHFSLGTNEAPAWTTGHLCWYPSHLQQWPASAASVQDETSLHFLS